MDAKQCAAPLALSVRRVRYNFISTDGVGGFGRRGLKESLNQSVGADICGEMAEWLKATVC
jgi:hypothetical protein